MARYQILEKRFGRISMAHAFLEPLSSSRFWTRMWFWALVSFVALSIRQALVSHSLAQFLSSLILMVLGIALAWWVLLMWNVVFSLGLHEDRDESEKTH